MKNEYEKWIKEKLETESPFLKCSEWTLEMQQDFPELQRVRGTVTLSNGWERHHWWLFDGAEIVDPTASQFQLPYYGEHTRILAYSPHDESSPEPTGVCPNCSGYCYNGQTCCSESCFKSYVFYCNHPETL
jgi:hypothetical protein